MAPEENTPSDAEVKPAAPKKRAPRKKTAAAAPAEGDAGAPAASAEATAPAAAPAKKQRAPRKKTPKTAEKAPKSAPAADAPAPAPAPAAEKAPAAEEQKPAPQQSRQQQNRQQKNRQLQESTPAEKMTEKPAVRDSDIENPDAAPQLPPAPGFAAPETVGGGEGGGGGNRRKRRRNRNRNRENGQQPQQPQATPQVDKEELVRRAWKIFLGEVTEEGLALMDDRTAAEASRRAFRVAELFLIEAARHRPAPTASAVEEVEADEAETDDSAEEAVQE